MFFLFSFFITATATPARASISKQDCQTIASNLAWSKVPACISTPNNGKNVTLVLKYWSLLNGGRERETHWAKGHDISSSNFPDVNAGEKDVNKLPTSGQ